MPAQTDTPTKGYVLLVNEYHQIDQFLPGIGYTYVKRTKPDVVQLDDVEAARLLGVGAVVPVGKATDEQKAGTAEPVRFEVPAAPGSTEAEIFVRAPTAEEVVARAEQVGAAQTPGSPTQSAQLGGDQGQQK